MQAYGFVETRGFTGTAEATDAMNKAAQVEFVRQEQIGGGYATTICMGEVGAVKAAVEAGVVAAKRVGVLHASNVIARLHDEVVDVVIRWKSPKEEIQPQLALGLLEAAGFTPMVEAADAGVKAANVQLANYVLVGGGYATVIFRGEVAAVRSAVAAGAAQSGKVGKVVSQHVIPSPHPLMQQILPLGIAPKKGKSVEVPADLERALGFIEFKGYAGLVEATDAGVKAAHVVPVGWQKVGAGLVTILLQGDVAAVKSAVDAGSTAGARVGELVSTNVIPRPHDALESLKSQPKKK